MKPRVRPAPSERSTLNQLYSELSPLVLTAAAQAGFWGTMLPCGLSPSFQHRNVRLPGTIIAPWADAGAAMSTVASNAGAMVRAIASALFRRFFKTLPFLPGLHPG